MRVLCAIETVETAPTPLRRSPEWTPGCRIRDSRSISGDDVDLRASVEHGPEHGDPPVLVDARDLYGAQKYRRSLGSEYGGRPDSLVRSVVVLLLIAVGVLNS